MSVADHWTVLSLASNFLSLAALTVSKISVIRANLSLWFPWMCGVAIVKVEFGKVIKKSSKISLSVELRKHLQFYRHFKLVWCTHCENNSCLCSWIRNILLLSILFMLQWYVMKRLSLIIFYFTLAMYPQFFTILLMSPKCLPNIACLLNWPSVITLNCEFDMLVMT